MGDDVHRLLRLVDEATDPSWDNELSEDATDPDRQAATHERAAAALGAIAFLLLRKDEEMWDEWLKY